MRVALGRIWRRRLFAMLIDALVVITTHFVALNLRFELQVPADYAWSSGFLPFVLVASAVYVLGHWLFGVYDIVNRYIGLVQAVRIAQVTAGAGLLLLVIDRFWPGHTHPVPLTVVLIGNIFTLVAFTGIRFYSRIFHERSFLNVKPVKNLLIVGAGQAAEIAIREIGRSSGLRTRVVGLVDDNRALHGMRIHKHRVLGSIEDVPAIALANDVHEILIAIPSATPDQLARVQRLCRPTGLPITVLPSLRALVLGEISVSDARPLDIRDLLGRAEVETDLSAIREYVRGKRVLVTGAAGSIGSELCRQLIPFEPSELVLVDKDESALYYLHEQLRSTPLESYSIHPHSVALASKMNHLFATYTPHLVFHAAALKHVPLMEMHPDEAIVNNVRGTLVVAELAGRYGAERVVNISTDKAVDPVNVMGATKRVGEQVLQHLAKEYPDTRFSSVRFGNVLGSRGSVIPLFTSQIKAGGPVAVTHPEMTRYFMTIEEAVQLVLQAAALMDDLSRSEHGQHGAFVLEMGEPVKILELAHRMIDLLGNGHRDEIKIDFTGLRPGERLHEALFCENEIARPTKHPLIRLAVPADSPEGSGGDLRPDFETILAELVVAAEYNDNPQRLYALLAACVPGYKPFDWMQVGQFPGVKRSLRLIDESQGVRNTPIMSPLKDVLMARLTAERAKEVEIRQAG
jgi:FlaA1/EpsC-like NDP-sugar epimerase